MVCVLALLPILDPVASTAQTGIPQPYKLSDTSRFETGCFTLCDCAIVSQPLQGTFLLEPLAPGPLFNEYRVLDVRWTVPGASSISITGSGTYRLGGEVAVQHQMTLDLSIDGGSVQHFDSGILGTTNDLFPKIEIRIPLHGDSTCVDTVLVVHAAPAAPVASGVESSSPEPSISLRAVHANPFRERAELAVRVARPGDVTIEIVDVHGRMVRRWTWEAASAGEHPLVWDGRDGSGEESSSGVYLVRARQLDRVAIARVLRIR